MRTPRCRSTRRSSRSSRTCTRPACACASKRSGATTSRRSTASATTTTGSSSTSTTTMRRRCCRRAPSSHLIGFLDTTAANQQSRRPAKLGRRRPPLDRQHVHRPRLLGHAHRRAVPGRDGQAPQNMKNRNDYDIGCPLCWAPPTADDDAGHDQPAEASDAIGRVRRGSRRGCCSLRSRLPPG